jgi:hypothetical protein
MKFLRRLLLAMAALAALLAINSHWASATEADAYWQCVAPSATHPNGSWCPVGTNTPVPAFAPWTSSTNCSGTITAGAASQQMIPAGPKHGYQIQNESADLLAFSEFTTSPVVNTNGSWTLTPESSGVAGGSYNTPATYSPSAAVWIIGANTGDKFTCAYW